MGDHELEEDYHMNIDNDISSYYTEGFLTYYHYAIEYNNKAHDVDRNKRFCEEISYIQRNINAFDDTISYCLFNINNYKFDSKEDKDRFKYLLENNKMNLLDIEMLDFLHNKIQYRRIYYSYIILTLALDASSFMHFSLDALKSNRMSVAYALLRKPLKENLFFLEWLLVDSDDFFSNVYESVKNSGNFFNSVRKSKIKAIFNKAFKEVYEFISTRTEKLSPVYYYENNENYKEYKERVYSTRYNNTRDKSLCFYWNYAIHLCSKDTIGMNTFPTTEMYNYDEVNNCFEIYLEENMYVIPYFEALFELLYNKYYIQ